METENQLQVLNSMLQASSGGGGGGGSSPDTSPLCLQTKNKRKNFNPRFAETKDDDMHMKSEPPPVGESDSEEQEEEEDDGSPNPATIATLMAAGNFEAAARQSEAESKFRDFAFKTMQELLNIYGLSLTFSDVVDAFKQQQQKMREGKCAARQSLMLHLRNFLMDTKFP